MPKGLETGQGLGALLGSDADDLDILLGNKTENPGEGAVYLPVEKIEPRKDQPRRTFDQAILAELAESIKEHGVIQPLTVRPLDGGYYQIIAGERRWRASRMAGLTRVPVRIMDADDLKTAQLALVENLQREDLNPVEEALGYKALGEAYGLTQEAIARKVGKSRPAITNAMRLLALPEDVLRLVEDAELSVSHARLLLEVEDMETVRLAASETVRCGLTVRGLEQYLAKLKRGEKKKENERVYPDGVDYMAEVEKDLTRSLGRRVKVVEGKKKGRIEIEFYGADDFDDVYRALLKLRSSGKEETK